MMEMEPALRVKSLGLLLVGMGFLSLAKVKHTVRGYKTPRPFSIADVNRAVDYDLRVVSDWLEAPQLAGLASLDLGGRRIVELGPGADLGVGLVLLAKGAQSYTGFDKFPLAGALPVSLYRSMVSRLSDASDPRKTDDLLDQVTALQQGEPLALRYVHSPDFDLTRHFAPASVDLVLSNAAFEHFDDVEKTIRDVDRICAPGARAVIGVDLQTHSRWIREVDPNNIYRFPDWLYRLFRFPGIPNRVRPRTYVKAFEACGWKDVRIVANGVSHTALSAYPSMARRFRRPEDDMHVLSFLLLAHKP